MIGVFGNAEYVVVGPTFIRMTHARHNSFDEFVTENSSFQHLQKWSE